MTLEQLRPVATISLAAAAGWIGWSGTPLLLPAATLFPVLWSISNTRRQAALVSAAYFLAASCGLPQGVATFYSTDLLPGLVLWLAASLSFVAVHVMAWSRRDGWRKPVYSSVASIAMALPPFGILGWAHPLTAAGILFPDQAWLGLGLTFALLAGLTTRRRAIVAVAIGGLWLWSVDHWTFPEEPVAWRGLALQMGATLGRDPSLQRQQDLMRLAGAGPAGTTLVLPESAIGYWTPGVRRLWQAQVDRTGTVVIAGATVITADGYDNALVKIAPDSTGIIYRQRMPVPGSMWQPWRRLFGADGGAKAYFFANPVLDINGTRVAPLICYEQLILWPVLQSMLYDPAVIVAVGNGWWTGETAIVAIQRASAVAFARLFGKPLVFSFNT
jgi:hypothetical protein